VGETRLLVLGAGPAQLGLLAAARRLGVAVVAADRDPGAPGFRYAGRRALISVEDEPALDRLAVAEQVDGVIAPGSDRSLAIAARIAAKLQVPHPLSPATAQAAAARQREREALAAAGIPQPEAAYCHSLAEAQDAAARLGFPCVVSALDRQRDGRAAAGNPAELALAMTAALADSRASSCLVEEQPLGRALTVTAFAAGGRVEPLLVSEESSEGIVWPAAADPAPIGAALELVRRATAALGVEAGPLTGRVVLRGGMPCLVGLAPRLGRAHEAELAHAVTGVDVHALALAAALGRKIEGAELRPAARVGGACVAVLRSPGGTATPAGVEAAHAIPGIQGIRLHRRAGRACSEGEPVGALLAVGSDRRAALATARRALGLIRFESVDAPTLV
jgi:biotin carboxylase